MGRTRRAIAIVVACIVGAFALSTTWGLGYFVGSSHASGPAGAQSYDVEPEATVTLALRDYRFEPRELRVPAGRLVEIELVNEDTSVHTFTYVLDGRTYDHRIPAGETSRVLTRFAAPGEVPYWCRPHSAGEGGTDADGMRGAILVEA